MRPHGECRLNFRGGTSSRELREATSKERRRAQRFRNIEHRPRKTAPNTSSVSGRGEGPRIYEKSRRWCLRLSSPPRAQNGPRSLILVESPPEGHPQSRPPRRCPSGPTTGTRDSLGTPGTSVRGGSSVSITGTPLS